MIFGVPSVCRSISLVFAALLQQLLFVWVYLGDEIPLNEFAELRTRVISKDQIETEEERAYYDYTCHTEDIIKSMMLVSPDKNIDDLRREKRILGFLWEENRLPLASLSEHLFKVEWQRGRIDLQNLFFV